MKRPIFSTIRRTFNLFGSSCNWYYNRLWISRIIALISVANLCVIAFDLSYIPLRDIWLNGRVTVASFKVGPYEYEGIRLKVLPDSWSETITNYDVIKGIEPYRQTEQYLEDVDELILTIRTYGLDNNLTREILSALRAETVDIIEQNPFELANKSGNLEKIKNKIRDHMDPHFDNPRDSARQAFINFWTTSHLEGRALNELTFFNREIRPLINTNFYRPLGENGEYIDNYGLVDFPFFLILFVDFLIRCVGISYRYNGVNFFDAILWRWYDLIFLLPTWRWLRIIPVTIRLDEAKLLQSGGIKKQVSQGFVAGIAEDVTEVVVLRVVNQLQTVFKEGQIEKLLTPAKEDREYIDLNNTNEVTEITKVLINLMAYRVLPGIRDDVEQLLVYTIEKSISESDVYKNVKNLPGLNGFSHKISTSLATQLYQTLSDGVTNLLEEDPVFDEHLEQIIVKFSKTIQFSSATEYEITRIEDMLVALLEEVKVNYIQKLSDADVDALLDEKRALRQKKPVNNKIYTSTKPPRIR